MAYTRNPQWKDHPDTSTPITAAKLENIESGIEAAAATADAALSSGGGSGSPIDIHVGAPTGTDDQTLINTAIATAKTAGQPARLIFPPGTYVCSAPLTSMASTSMIEFMGGGGRHPRTFPVGPRTEIRYTGTGAGTFIDATDASGFTITGLDVTYSSTSFTGTLINAGAVGVGPSYSPKFRDCFLGSTAPTTMTATILDLGLVVECSLHDCIISGGAVGIDGSGTYSNAVTMSGGRFEYCAIAVKNPRFQWTFSGVVFEPGCVIKSVGQDAEGLAFHGCGWWDNTTNPWAWIDVQGSGLSITGGYWEPQGGSGENLVKLQGAFDGLSITGLKGHGMNGSTGSPLLALAAGASVTNLNYAGNSLTNCIDGIAAAQTVGAVIHSPGRATRETRNLGNSGAALTLPLVTSASFFLTANCALTLPTVPSGYEHRMRLLITQDGTGSRTITWPSTVDWPGGVAPTLTTTAEHTDVIELSTVDGGANWLGRVVAQNYALTGMTSLPSPVAVYDASLLGLSNGDPVATWADSSGNARDVTQGTTGARPSYVTGALNGKAVVRFPSTADRYLFSPSVYANATLFPSGTYSVIAVAKPDLTGSYACIAGIDPNAETARLFQLRVNWNAGSPLAEALAFTSGAAGNATDSQAVTAGAAHVFSMVRDTGTVQAWVDGVSGGSTAIGAVQTTGSARIAVGSGGVQETSANEIALGWVGDIAYLAIYPGALTTAQRQSEEARLKALYGTP